MTAEELAAVGSTFLEALAPYAEQLTDPDARPEGARPVGIVAWGHRLRAAERDRSIGGGPADLAEGSAR